MLRSSCMVFCGLCATLLLLPIIFTPGINASVIPAPANNQHSIHQVQRLEQKIAKDEIMTLPNSFSLISQEGLFPSFDNGTSLLRAKMHERYRRVKRSNCKERPDREVMEYFELKLANRCWDDCDCRSGRYCTTHSWCHDLPNH